MPTLFDAVRRAHARIVSAFPDRELYVRSNGRVRFVRVSSALQLRAVAIAAIGAMVWLTVSSALLLAQSRVAAREAAVDVKARAAAETAHRVAAYRETIDDKVDRLEARQAILDSLAEQYFGKHEARAVGRTTAVPPDAGAAVVPGTARLARVEAAQLTFAQGVTSLAEARLQRAEATVRRLGLNPNRLARGAASAMGGPFVPFGRPRSAASGDDHFAAMHAVLARLDSIERALLAVPSFKPAANSTLSSGFGFRFDPFTRWPAMHQGQDFSGRHGEPIRAAAPGRVIRAGWWAGYGRAVEIDHGRGLTTRYGHMSALDVRPGQRVERGDSVGRMGSTGRSTGTHLHFEVRVDGRAVNPRPFLEASADVLEIQGSIRERIDGQPARRPGNAG